MPARPTPWLAVLIAFVVPFTMLPAARAGDPTGPDDPALVEGLQWNLEAIGAPRAWPISRGDGITIAIVDSGIDLRHPDLASKIVGDISCIGTGGDPALCGGSGQDTDGHGTHVAGIAAAVTDNDIGVAGVAPGAKLLAVRVLTDACGRDRRCLAEGDATDVAAGIRWSVDHGARVINLSVGATARALARPAFVAALDDAWRRGAVPVVATGNDHSRTTGFATQPVVVVTAVNRQGTLASYASGIGDARWGLAAPGGEPGDTPATCRPGAHPRGVISTYWRHGATNRYACLSGTSMAAPHVSGALAILLGMGLEPRQAVHRLLTTARPAGAPEAGVLGAGRLDLVRAVTLGPPMSATTVAPARETRAAVGPPGEGDGRPGALEPPGDDSPAGWVAAAALFADAMLVAQLVVASRRRRSPTRTLP